MTITGSEIKRRRKTSETKPNEKARGTSKLTDGKKAPTNESNVSCGAEVSSSLDFKTLTCLLFIIMSLGLSWFMLQQNAKFNGIEEKFEELHRKTGELQKLHDEIITVTEKSDRIQATVAKLETWPLLHQVEKLKGDVAELAMWASDVAQKRGQLQARVTELTQAVRSTEEHVATMARDCSAQVGAVRTDVRRMSGLGAETEELLGRLGTLEEKVAWVELSMAKRIGDLLAGSIDRVTALRVSSERNSKEMEELRQRAEELAVADAELAAHLLALEDGNARLVRTVAFAADLKPKVSTIRRNLGAMEPVLNDLTLRVGNLAEDLGRRAKDVALLRGTCANLSVSQGAQQDDQQQLTQVPSEGQIFPQTQPAGE